MRIGEVAQHLKLSTDTLRYYEKIGLLPYITRLSSGLRAYSKTDISRLWFIRRAQRMGFRLSEIALLLGFREDPQRARPAVREMAAEKREDIKTHLEDLQVLHDELQSLIGRCEDGEEGCPILDEIDRHRRDEKMGVV